MTTSPQPDELLHQAMVAGDQGRLAEALALTDRCLEQVPGWTKARGLRAAVLADLGRSAEARDEARALIPLEPTAATILAEIVARCEADLAGARAADAPDAPAVAAARRDAVPAAPVAHGARFDGIRGVLPIAAATPAAAEATARAWAERIAAAVEDRGAGRWTTRVATVPRRTAGGEEEGSDGWVDVFAGSRLRGRVRVAWARTRPAELVVEATSVDAPHRKARLARVVEALGVAAALGAFGLWVWFAIHDWTRIWNRVTSFSGPGPDRASKLEIGWLCVGWAMGPVFAWLGFGLVAAWIDGTARRCEIRRLDAFARRELDGVVRATLERA